MTPAGAPRTGDVYLASLDPVMGSEQGRTRPIVVFQALELGRFTTTFLCVPLTTNRRRLGLPGTCHIAKGQGGLRADSIALAFHMRSLDRARLSKRLGTLPQPTLERLSDTILGALGIETEDV